MTKRSVLMATASTVAFGPARAYALKSTVDKLDDIPEVLHAEYVEQGGKYVLQVEGMRPQADYERLQTAHTKEKNDHGALKQTVRNIFGEEKLEDVRIKLDRIPELELAAEGKLDDEKLNNIVEGRVRTKLAPVERERDQYKAKVNELEGTVGELTNKEKRRLIRDKAREAGVAAKLRPEAMDDFLLLADNVLEVRADDNEVVVKDNVGFTPGVQPSVLLTDLQPKRPHWWGESFGGGSGGNRDNSRGASNPYGKASWNMTAQGQLMANDPTKAEQMAKAAGHKDAATARKVDAK